jgi:hypothetical protein
VARIQGGFSYGAVLTLSGSQMGLIVAADLNGLVISLR